MRILALALVLIATGAGIAIAEPPRAEILVGTWRGRAAWKGCTVAGNAKITVGVTWKDGAYQIDLAGARDDLGTVALVPRDDGTAAGTRDDLEVTMKPGASAKITLATDAGCTATLTVARDGSGLAGCDRWMALATVESTCDAAGDARAAHLDDARGKLAGWKKLRGGKRKAADDACAKDAGELAAALGDNGCLPTVSAGGGLTGVPACDAYVGGVQRYAQCKNVPVEAKQALQQAITQMVEGWKMMREPGMPAEARKAAGDACKQALEALKQAATSVGCAI